MKTGITLAAVLLIGAGMVPAFAQQAPAGPGAGHGQMMPFGKAMFGAIDRDGDGKITQAEFDSWRSARADGLDADGDGKISVDELTAWEVARFEAVARARAEKRVEALDLDGDGKLSAAELLVAPVPEEAFARFDKDGDGAVVPGDFGRMMRRAPGDGRQDSMRDGGPRGPGRGDRMGHDEGRGPRHPIPDAAPADAPKE